MQFIFFPVEALISTVPTAMGLVYKLNEEDVDNYVLNIDKEFKDETEYNGFKQETLCDFDYSEALKEQLKSKEE